MNKSNKGIQMDLKNHFFLTFVALFFLGLIFTKPGNVLLQNQEARDCKLVKGKMDCYHKNQEYRMNDSQNAVSYQMLEDKK